MIYLFTFFTFVLTDYYIQRKAELNNVIFETYIFFEVK